MFKYTFLFKSFMEWILFIKVFFRQDLQDLKNFLFVHHLPEESDEIHSAFLFIQKDKR